MTLKQAARTVLRVGLGITFVWIGVRIFMDPAGWGSLAQPWAVRLLPVPLVVFMQANALFDLLVGAMLLIGLWPWLAGAVGAGHILAVLAATGVTDVTVRDIGLFAACVALALDTIPDRLLAKLKPKAATPSVPDR